MLPTYGTYQTRTLFCIQVVSMSIPLGFGRKFLIESLESLIIIPLIVEHLKVWSPVLALPGCHFWLVQCRIIIVLVVEYTFS